jgi:hypothetical protein
MSTTLPLLETPCAPEGYQTDFDAEQLSLTDFSEWLTPSGLKAVFEDEFLNNTPHLSSTDWSDLTVCNFNADPSYHHASDLTSSVASAQAFSIPATKSNRKGKRSYASRYDIDAGQLSSPFASDESNDQVQESEKPYHCTSCPSEFKDVYGWKRHEVGVHGFHIKEWICMLDDIVLDGRLCVFCGEEASHFGHFDKHNRSPCSDKTQLERTFARKDLLKQHIQHVHLTTTDEATKKAFKVPGFWGQDVDASRSKPASLWCGFCRFFLPSTAARMDHVANHFRDGRDMSTWQLLSSG